ncbi:hypothetical protein B0J15DRAFT_121857 [Fusarium solani]|uniref:Secreted protein n=1 Tax=Fusarium solani TaxID=169388 RepID=A0A9P9L534_FUSSL|nr:uncharacterized protein B0J15DRAFT_121857 [Fusarium solani]KAH7274137.1 hypothetical protein B0J15DRAFT_121857 [Fusarium solani]
MAGWPASTASLFLLACRITGVSVLSTEKQICPGSCVALRLAQWLFAASKPGSHELQPLFVCVSRSMDHSPLPVRAKPVVLLSCIVPLFLPLVLACSAFRACFCRTPIPDLATPSGTRASRFIAHRWIPSFSHVARIHTPECIPLPLLFRLPAQGHTEQTYDQQPPTSRNLWPPTRTSLLPLRRRRRRSAPIQGSQCDLFTSNYSLYQYSHLWC